MQTDILDQAAELKAPTPGDARPAAAANLHVGVADRDRYRDSPTANGVGDDLPALPAGTVTFIFTDIEDDKDLLRNLGGEVFGESAGAIVTASAKRPLPTTVERSASKGMPCSSCFRVPRTRSAAAHDLQAALAEGPVRVRIGIHTGEPLVVDNEYVGLDVHKAARICAAAHGGQVLVSQATRDLAGDGLA